MPKSLAICMSVCSLYDMQSHVLRCVAKFSRLTGLYIFFFVPWGKWDTRDLLTSHYTCVLSVFCLVLQVFILRLLQIFLRNINTERLCKRLFLFGNQKWNGCFTAVSLTSVVWEKTTHLIELIFVCLGMITHLIELIFCLFRYCSW